MRYVLGIDGGATKTHCALYDADTGRLDFMPYGAAGHERLRGGFDELPGVLRGAFRSLLSRSNIGFDDIEMGVIGLSGVDSPGQHRIVSEILSNLGLKRFSLYNDAFLGAFTGSGGSGICAVNGTGSCVAGLDASGKFVKIGGLGTLTGDFGGGLMLSRRAAGLVYSQLYRDAPYTALTTAMFRWLNVTDRDEFWGLITERLQNEPEETTLALCRHLFETAAEGDAAALALLEESGRSYAGGIAGAINDLTYAPGEPVEVIFAGSVFTKGACDCIQKTAEAVLRQKFPRSGFIFRTLDVPCVAGAVVRALRELGVEERRDSVLRLFRGAVSLQGADKAI
ncbi:MAG: hypothetical protein LBR76_01225 [Oscillospiraceae bacterium]|jgi:N-acetylglucosamine kinase-like BadF-type ATPase|nr:hypothetical protein [Oscillospiraceae bacterium]